MSAPPYSQYDCIINWLSDSTKSTSNPPKQLGRKGSRRSALTKRNPNTMNQLFIPLTTPSKSRKHRRRAIGEEEENDKDEGEVDDEDDAAAQATPRAFLHPDSSIASSSSRSRNSSPTRLLQYVFCARTHTLRAAAWCGERWYIR